MSGSAAAANIGYGWWSHDIGGHLWGVRDDELASRRVQLGVFCSEKLRDDGRTDEPGRPGDEDAHADPIPPAVGGPSLSATDMDSPT